MKFLSYLIIFMCVTIGCQSKKRPEQIYRPPVAKKIKMELTTHGNSRIDNYFWLRYKENPEVIKYLEEENFYTKNMLAPAENLQNKIYDEIVGRIKGKDISIPYKLNGYYYYTTYEEGKEYPLYFRKKDNLESTAELLLDVNIMAKELSYCYLGMIAVSQNNKLLAFSIDKTGSMRYEIWFKDLNTGKIYYEGLSDALWRPVWANDNKTIFYTKRDSAGRGYKIYKHILGSDESDDECVYHENDHEYSVYVYKTNSQKYIVIASRKKTSTEIRFLDANDPQGAFKTIQKRRNNLFYEVFHFKDKFFIRTNYKAKNYRLMEARVNNPGIENWTEVIPYNHEVYLERSLKVFANYLVCNEKRDGLNKFKIIKTKTGEDYYVDPGEHAYTIDFYDNYEFETNKFIYTYSSMTTAPSIIEYNMDTKSAKILKTEVADETFDSKNYITERLFARARDGSKIPISIVYKAKLPKNGDNPMLLMGYGAYGRNKNPEFDPAIFSLLDRGFIYGIAHVRGSRTMGEYWYEEGKLLNKKNSFTDFIDCAEYLISEKYTNSKKLFAQGRSAGGLLVGAVMNMRPDLFKGIIADVPWVDVVTSMLDESIPLVTGEYVEWGNPNQKEYYDYILSYSPYDNVEEKDYPALLVTTGLNDENVVYWEPTKWVAKLRDMKTDNNILLLSVNMDSGHGGASGRFETYKETAMKYAFICNLIGITE